MLMCANGSLDLSPRDSPCIRLPCLPRGHLRVSTSPYWVCCSMLTWPLFSPVFLAPSHTLFISIPYGFHLQITSMSDHFSEPQWSPVLIWMDLMVSSHDALWPHYLCHHPCIISSSQQLDEEIRPPHSFEQNSLGVKLDSKDIPLGPTHPHPILLWPLPITRLALEHTRTSETMLPSA